MDVATTMEERVEVVGGKEEQEQEQEEEEEEVVLVDLMSAEVNLVEANNSAEEEVAAFVVVRFDLLHPDA